MGSGSGVALGRSELRLAHPLLLRWRVKHSGHRRILRGAPRYVGGAPVGCGQPVRRCRVCVRQPGTEPARLHHAHLPGNRQAPSVADRPCEVGPVHLDLRAGGDRLRCAGDRRPRHPPPNRGTGMGTDRAGLVLRPHEPRPAAQEGAALQRAWHEALRYSASSAAQPDAIRRHRAVVGGLHQQRRLVDQRLRRDGAAYPGPSTS